MQQLEEAILICPVHGQTTLSVLFEGCENNQIGCLNCVNRKLVMRNQTFKQITSFLLTKKNQVISDMEKTCEKRIDTLYELFLKIKNQLNENLENILNIITDQAKIINLNIKKEYENVQQMEQPENEIDVANIFKDYYEQKQTLQSNCFSKIYQMRDKVLGEYYGLQENLNEKIKNECFWSKFKEQKATSSPLPEQSECNYEFLLRKNVNNPCFSLAMDKDEKILVSTCGIDVLVWEFNNEEIILKNTLFGHTSLVLCLCFSKKENWFISGASDALRVWYQDENDQWFQYQELDDIQNSFVREIILNNEEDQFISYGRDKIIRIWMKKYNGLLWQCVQNISDCIFFLNYLCLSPDCNYLVSGEFVMWEKGDDQLWKFKQFVEQPIDEGEIDLYDEQYYILDARVKFISNDEYLVQVQKYGRLFRVTKNSKGVFQVTSELVVNFYKSEYEGYHSFPIIYNPQQRCTIIKNERTLRILKQLNNGDFIINQSIDEKYYAGYLFKNGEYLILGSWGCLQIWKNI